MHPGDEKLALRLCRELEGDVLFGPLERGRYSTDASIYQIEPGTSQGGQAIGESLVVDCSKYLRGVVDFDAAARTVTVEPGIVLDHLNAFLKPHGLFFPVDPATANRATGWCVRSSSSPCWATA